MDNGSACASIEFDTKDLPKAENIPAAAGLSIQTWWGSYLLRSYLAPWLLLRVHNQARTRSFYWFGCYMALIHSVNVLLYELRIIVIDI